jgi:hypothetical protein
VIAPHKKLRIIVCGMVGQFPLGGVAWDYFHYVLGLHQLGHDVYYHEDTFLWPNNPALGYPSEDPSYSVNFIKSFFAAYAPELANKWHYRVLRKDSYGMTFEQFEEVVRTCDIFLNVSGASFLPDALNPKAVKVFMDTDPGYNQIVMAEKPAWVDDAEGSWKTLMRHDKCLTYAENIYNDDCVIPRLGIDWHITRCIATLPEWKSIKDAPSPAGAPFTTIMSWSYYKGPLEHKGVHYDQKAPEFDKFIDLPKHTKMPLRLAVAGYHQPADQIRQAGWQLVPGIEVSLTAEQYLHFIRDSAGEWSIAKNVFVGTRSGWFSCRTACYLAAGRPAVVQDTGWSKFIPSGNGLFAFNTMAECVAALDEVNAKPAQHRAAAYDMAREYIAPDKVLPPMLEAIFSSKRENPTGPGPIPPSK